MKLIFLTAACKFAKVYIKPQKKNLLGKLMAHKKWPERDLDVYICMQLYIFIEKCDLCC